MKKNPGILRIVAVILLLLGIVWNSGCDAKAPDTKGFLSYLKTTCSLHDMSLRKSEFTFDESTKTVTITIQCRDPAELQYPESIASDYLNPLPAAAERYRIGKISARTFVMDPKGTTVFSKAIGD